MNTYLKVELCDQNIDHDFLPDLFFATSKHRSVAASFLVVETSNLSSLSSPSCPPATT